MMIFICFHFVLFYSLKYQNLPITLHYCPSDDILNVLDQMLPSTHVAFLPNPFLLQLEWFLKRLLFIFSWVKICWSCCTLLTWVQFLPTLPTSGLAYFLVYLVRYCMAVWPWPGRQKETCPSPATSLLRSVHSTDPSVCELPSQWRLPSLNNKSRLTFKKEFPSVGTGRTWTQIPKDSNLSLFLSSFVVGNTWKKNIFYWHFRASRLLSGKIFSLIRVASKDCKRMGDFGTCRGLFGCLWWQKTGKIPTIYWLYKNCLR